MTTLHAIILGLVEGVTEFLPVSSTGHLILTSALFGIADDPFTKTFEIVIQLGAICAVIFLYWRTLVYDRDMIRKILVAFIPTAILGALLYPFIKILLGRPFVVISALFLGGILLIIVDKFLGRRLTTPTISYRQACGVGIFQALAFIPGVSRAAATIIGGELLGVSRQTIVQFSFLLAIPTMLAATALDIAKNTVLFGSQSIVLLGIGGLVAAFAAMYTIKLFLTYMERGSFVVFGVYRIILALLWLIFVG